MPDSAGLESTEGAQRVLAARLDNVRLLTDALSCIYSSTHRALDVVLSIPEAGGLKFSVEQTGCLQASVLLPIDVFASFDCSEWSTRVRLNLCLLLECLNIFSSSGQQERAPTPIRLTYDGEGHALVLQFQEQDAQTVCKLNTINNDYLDEMETDFQFSRHQVLNLALLQSEVLRDAIAELDYAGATTAELRLAPVPPRFRFQSPAAAFRVVDGDVAGGSDKARRGRPKRRRTRLVGSEGSNTDESSRSGDPGGAESTEGAYVYDEAQCAVDLPDPEDRSLSVFTEFKSLQAQTSSYRLDLLSRCSKALSMSETCKLQMNEDGMLSIVCRMRPGMASSAAAASNERRPMSNSSKHIFTEFLIVADEIIDDLGVPS